MKNFQKILSYFLLIFILTSCNKKKDIYVNKISDKRESIFTKEIRDYYFQTLDSASYYISKIDTLSSTIENKKNLLESRKWYKRAEPLLIAYDYQNYLSLNAPNLLKVEMEDYTEIKKIKPKSYQVLEEYFYGDEIINNRELHRVYSYLQARLPFVKKNHIIYKQTDSHHLKMIRDVIINVATKGITGFDSPMLANSLIEAVYNYETIEKVLDIYKNGFSNYEIYNKWKKEINKTILLLNSGEFDEFNRYSFIKNHSNYQLELINNTAKDWNITLNKSRPLNPKSTNIFSKNFFNKKQFSLPNSPDISNEMILLGKQLFNDKNLSKSGKISCATCHNQKRVFTDGLEVARGLNNKKLQRNTPTLPYAIYQKSFFYDGRSGGLEDQIVSVANNENEFHIDLNIIEERVKSSKKYKTQFDSLYNGKITNLNVRNAIANYIRSLTPFDSKFDRNMQGIENTLSEEEIRGFNLFMGKAACATCHFPPTFYGTVPPKFDETEFENLGVTKTSNFKSPLIDNDAGLFYPYEVEERRGFFKTSTVRNIELTAPYMHNGIYKSLDKVLEFYNNGGGAGMGLDVPYQTLPADSLNLDNSEISSIIAFMKTLTDKEYEIESK